MGIRYSLPLNDYISLRGRIGGRRRYWAGRHYYPAGPQSLTGAFVRYGLVYPMIGMLALAVGFSARRPVRLSSRTASSRPSGLLSPSPTASSRPSGLSRLRRTPPLVGWWPDEPLGPHSRPH